MDKNTGFRSSVCADSNSPRLPKVSIGMPVFNGQYSIGDALDSLLVQSFTDFEIIISDNASTDKTEAICREFLAKDQRIRYVRQLVNRGAAYNFQFVLDEAVGKYFMWAAADDSWSSTFIEVNLANLLSNRGLIGSISRVNFRATNYTRESSSAFPIVGSTINRLLKFWRDPGDNSRFYSLFKRSALAIIDLKKYKFHAADWLVIALLLEVGELGSVDEALMTRALTPAENYINAAKSSNSSFSTFGFDLLPMTCYYFRSLSFVYKIRLLPLFVLLNLKIFKAYKLSNFFNMNHSLN